MATWSTLSEAQRLLGVQAQTIYAYASRGRIGVSPDPSDPRKSLYRTEDLSALVRKKVTGRKRETLAASTIFGAEPCISTGLCAFRQGRPYYRGKDVIALAEHASLEDAARLLWETEGMPVFSHRIGALPDLPAGRERAFVALAMASSKGHSTTGRIRKALHAEAAQLVGYLAEAFGADNDQTLPLHERLARGWGQPEEVGQLLRRAMVLLADHEITSSAFSARITASTGASLPACLLTGLTTFSGPLHGDASGRVRALFDEVERAGAHAVVDRYLSSALPIPGFGHHLYPEGDPRGAALMAVLDVPDEIRRMTDKVETLTGLKPNIDAGLATLVARYRLPSDAAFALFALARSIGLLAHSIEQLNVGMVIRPRGRYTGPAIELEPELKPPTQTQAQPGR